MKNPLTVKETFVLKQMLREKSSNVIAREFNMKLSELEKIRQRIYSKLEVKTSIGLAKKAMELGY